MRSIGSAIVLLVVLLVVGFLALRETQTVLPAAAGASGALPKGPVQRSQAAQERAVGEVAKAFDAASANRSAAEDR